MAAAHPPSSLRLAVPELSRAVVLFRVIKAENHLNKLLFANQWVTEQYIKTWLIIAKRGFFAP
jgi:hypothetical protein